MNPNKINQSFKLTPILQNKIILKSFHRLKLKIKRFKLKSNKCKWNNPNKKEEERDQLETQETIKKKIKNLQNLKYHWINYKSAQRLKYLLTTLIFNPSKNL